MFRFHGVRRAAGRAGRQGRRQDKPFAEGVFSADIPELGLQDEMLCRLGEKPHGAVLHGLQAELQGKHRGRAGLHAFRHENNDTKRAQSVARLGGY